MQENDLSKQVIGAAIEVHKFLGPGLLESAYPRCLAKELTIRGISYRTEVPVNINYKGEDINAGYRVDFIVNSKIIVELKSVENLLPIHDAQLLSYLRLCDAKLGLLINFNTTLLKNGIKRIVNNL